MVPPTISCNDQGLLRANQCFRNSSNSILRQSSRFHGIPKSHVKFIRVQVLFHDFSGTTQIHGSLGVTHSELQGSRNHLLDILPGLDLARVTAVLGYDLLLIWHILNPVDVLGS